MNENLGSVSEPRSPAPQNASVPALHDIRYELLPFASGEEQAQAALEPLTVTVTSSPKHGIDHTVGVATRMRGFGHSVIVHVAAREVRSEAHAQELLARMADAGIADVFLVGGDTTTARGPYHSALDLLPVVRAGANAPRTIGVGGYPEGHPSIADAVLDDALRLKAQGADYITTQLCFDARAIVRWLERMRARGIQLPVYVGMPGAVDRRKLVEISMRVGVGASVSFLRKQRDLRRLVGRRKDAPRQLLDEIVPLVGGDLGIAGLHFFTFNRLGDTVRLAVDAAAMPATAGDA